MRTGLVLSCSFLDREVGFCHVRVQTWVPFTIQISGTGHEWLARQRDPRGLRDRRLEHAFLALDAPGHGQRLADRCATLDWPAVLDGVAPRVHPHLRDELEGARDDWATHQAESATDVLFPNRAAVRERSPRLRRHATRCLRAEAVLTVLGRSTGASRARACTRGSAAGRGRASRTRGRAPGSRWTTRTGACCASGP